MLVLLSPSKTQDFSPSTRITAPTQPELLKESEKLVRTLRKMNEADIGNLMHISDKLAALNHQRYRGFSTPFTPENAKPAVLAFKGDVYDGLDADSLNATDLDFAQHSLRMLSGLYGILRPYDLMQPYRLEMKTPLPNLRGKDLYAFWGNRITDALNRHLESEHTDTVINLASGEYFKAVQPKRLKGKLVTVHFKERKGNELKVIGLFAKRARGMMARHIVRHRITASEGITGFNEEGYRFEPELSSAAEFVFARNQAKG